MAETGDRLPDWADAQLSRELPVLRARGEGQDIEYMEAFPQNTRELAKEIAAFATSNSGTILIGVSDNGDLAGISDTDTAKGRDALLQRTGGICRGTVKPSITPVAKFAVESGRTVLVLVIPKGGQPVYYASGVPHLRHLTESRPADPHEVIELVRAYLKSSNLVGEADGSSELHNLYSELARALVIVLLYADQIDERMVNPWLDMWRSEFADAAADLRNLAATDAAISEGIDGELTGLADRLDAVASMRLYIGSGSDLEEATKEAADIALELKGKLIDSKPLGAESLRTVRDVIKAGSRKLRGLTERADAMIDGGRIEEFQSEASGLGRRLLEVAYHNIDSLGQGLGDQLRRVGRELHLVETRTIYADGGASVKAIQDTVTQCSERLSALAAALE